MLSAIRKGDLNVLGYVAHGLHNMVTVDCLNEGSNELYLHLISRLHNDAKSK